MRLSAKDYKVLSFGLLLGPLAGALFFVFFGWRSGELGGSAGEVAGSILTIVGFSYFLGLLPAGLASALMILVFRRTESSWIRIGAAPVAGALACMIWVIFMASLTKAGGLSIHSMAGVTLIGAVAGFALVSLFEGLRHLSGRSRADAGVASN